MPDPPAPALDVVLARPEHGVRSLVDLALNRPDPRRPLAAERPRQRTPKGTLNRHVHSRPIRVPRADWVAVTSGTKRMFRCYADYWRDRFAPLFPDGEEFPRPAVLYSQPQHQRRYDAALAVVFAYRQEPLGAISPEDLLAEGFPALGLFKRYWKRRHARWGYRPRDMVSVVQLRPWTPQDNELQGRWALEQLYGDLL